MNQTKKSISDILIIGSGIYGNRLAYLLSKSGYKITILDKKSIKTTKNNSKGNSGVLHSGIYYHQDSLKRRHCLKGNALLQKYCIDRSIDLHMKGKLIIPSSQLEIEKNLVLFKNFEGNCRLISFFEAGSYSKVNLNLIKDVDIHYDNVVLYVPNSGFTNQMLVYQSVIDDISNDTKCNSLVNRIYLDDDSKISISYNEKHRIVKVFSQNQTKNHEFEAKYLVNSAGNNSLHFANKVNLGMDFKEIRLPANYYFNSFIDLNQMLIYPSSLNFSLGVHFTPSITKKGVYIGPTVDFDYNSLSSLFNLVMNFPIKTMISNRKFGFIYQLLQDLYHSNNIKGFHKLSNIYPQLKVYERSPIVKTLIRAPLINLKKCEFEKDFLVLHNEYSTHLLNIQSPGFTCFLSLCDSVYDEIQRKINQY